MQKDYVATLYNEAERPITTYPVQLASYLIERFKIPKNSLLLDVGCGRGDFSLGFMKNGLRVEGVDISDFAKKDLKKNGITLYMNDIIHDSWLFPDNYADVIFSKSVIEHIHDPNNFMKESYRVLKPGGRIIVMTPDWETVYKIFYDGHSHVQPYTKRGLKDLLRISGFRDIQTEQFYQLPIIWKYSFLKFFSSFLRRIMTPNTEIKNKFIRWSLELMCLGTGIK